MAELIYSAITSRDGYVEGERGDFEWARPDEEVLAVITDLVLRTGTHLYGRRMYETMLFWETADLDELSPFTREFANLWRAADKVVYSTSLAQVASARTCLEREFDPAAMARLKVTTTSGMSVGGAALAGQLITYGLVDGCQLFVTPVTVGGGKPALAEGALEGFDLVVERPFTSGVVLRQFRRVKSA